MKETSNKSEANVVKAWRRHLRLQRNLSANTLEAYLRDVEKLTTYLEGAGIALEEVTLDDLRHFAAGLHDIGISPRSQCRILSGVRSLYRFMLSLPEVLSTDEVDRMEAAIDLTKWEGHRNRAIIEVLFSCGLRVSELVGLRLSQLYLDEGYVRVTGKGSKERLVPISSRAVRELEFWFDDRCHMDIKSGEEDYVFLNRRGAHLTRTMVLIIIKGAAEAAGISKTVSPHTLRHSFATVLLEGGADLRAIQAIFFFNDTATTEIYTHIDMSTLRQEVLEHHPRNIRHRRVGEGLHQPHPPQDVVEVGHHHEEKDEAHADVLRHDEEADARLSPGEHLVEEEHHVSSVERRDG